MSLDEGSGVLEKVRKPARLHKINWEESTGPATNPFAAGCTVYD
jgi:hypothetical protein